MRHRVLYLSVALLTILGAANASTVTFGLIGGANGDAFTSTTENGITVTSTTGSWQMGHFVGNPVPSIFTFSSSASVTVTTGGLFGFTGFDLGTGGASLPSYAFTGFLNDVSVLSGSGTPGGNSFLTILNPDPSLVLDRLLISTTLTSSSANLDNIIVNEAVPEPGTVALLASGLAALLWAGRRRSR